MCIFTSNCTGALKIVGESFPFEAKSRFVLAEDSHNSVNGIRRYAEEKGATVDYVPARLRGGFKDSDMMVCQFHSELLANADIGFRGHYEMAPTHHPCWL